MIRRRQARSNLLDFTAYTKPDYSVSWHHRLMARTIDRFVEGAIKRLMIFIHPRSGKSELTSRRLPPYIFGRYPDAEIIACSANAALAGKMNRSAQRIMDSPSYKRLFPGSKLWGKNVRSSAQGAWIRNTDEFEIVDHTGSYRSAGIGGSIVGRGFTFGLIDDPIRSAADARSATLRESQWEWLTGDFLTRQMPDARILITLTRWHHDDIVGRLLASEAAKWTILRLPAIAEAERAHPEDPRQPGEALWEARYPLEFLLGQKATMGAHQFGALYQQNPTPREGGMFTYAALSRFVSSIPAGEGIERVRYWDKGYSAKGDWTVGVRMAKTPAGLYVVEDVQRFRAGPDERNRLIKRTAEMDDALVPGRWVRVFVEQPPGAGAETTERLVKFLAGHSVYAIRPQGSKEERAEPFAAQCEAGNVRLVTSPWNRAFIDECCVFPGGENDDQVDAASGAFLQVAGALTWINATDNPAARTEMSRAEGQGVFIETSEDEDTMGT